MAHGLVASVFGFGIVRFFLGLSESGNFPAAIKTTAEWFPKKERALAAGIFNSGTNIGAVLTPAIVPWLTLTYGWQAAFIATGAFGFIWLFFWVIYYQKPEASKKISNEEMSYILSDSEESVTEKISWLKLLRFRQTWAFIVGKVLSDPVWWFYLFWLGLFLNKNFGLTLSGLGLPLIVIYSMTTIGGIGGGWVSGFMIKRGIAVNKARKITMLICAIFALPAISAPHITNLWLAVAVLGLALSAHQGWSPNIFTTVSDMFPKKAVGSVVGIGSSIGSIGGMAFLASSGYIVQATGSYELLFIFCGSAYLIALGIMHLLTVNAKPVDI
jgi:ACS family hexuronate transporter-like MFS transporter